MRLENSRIVLEQDKCLVLQPEIAKLVGRSAALLFQQIHYWIASKNVDGIQHHGKKWVYNTYEGWAEDLKTVSKTTVNRSIRKLKDFGLITIEQFWAKNGNRTNHYTINYERVGELFPSLSEKPTVSPTPLLSEAYPSPKVTPSQSTLDSSLIQNESVLYRTKSSNKENLINHNLSDESKIISNQKIQENPKEKPLAQQMIDVWNTVISPEVSASLTQKRARFLIAALRYKFDNCLKKWETYCRKIASSDYLMGKIKQGFKIMLEAALNFDFIQKITEKYFGVRDIPQQVSFSEKEITPDLYPLETQKDLEIRKEIVNIIGGGEYHAWFERASVKATQDTLLIGVRSVFYKDWITNKYLTILENRLETRIIIQVNKTVNEQ